MFVVLNIIFLFVPSRILIPVLIFLGVVTLLPLIGSGPFWKDFMDKAILKCYQNPWAYVGMYANFLDMEEQVSNFD